MMNKNDFDKCIQGLRGSSMFYMSLGSKELFHSNFLHWLSIIKWEAFIAVMHKLADVNHFWWEDQYDANRIEVRREFHNFDISIYIKIGTKKTRDGQTNDVWLPVLILENKMKSLAYQDQLDEYLGKVYEEWSDYYKKNIAGNWTNGKVSFVVLSLIKPQNITDSNYCGKNGNNVSCAWVLNDYSDLSGIIKNQKGLIDKQFDIDIIADYCKFINALFTIAKEDWTISYEDNYIHKVCPKEQNVPFEEKEKMCQLEKLRIYDIREKIIYDQLVNFLEMELKKSQLTIKVERYKKDSYNTYKKHNSNNDRKILCNTNFYHNVGLFEAIYLIRGRKTAEDEPFFLTIQIQGKDYTRGISRKNIVDVKTVTKVIPGKRKEKKKTLNIIA